MGTMPILFSLYLDKLLDELRELGIGCHMNGLFTGAFIYADDITSIAPSCYALNSMFVKNMLCHMISCSTHCKLNTRNSLKLNPPPYIL